MRKVNPNIWAIAVLALVLVVGGLYGQLQQSGGGGSSITLLAGSNVAGKFGIDQTTPGTTNGVQVNSALPAGSNIVGNFRVDQTTPGTTNGVVVNSGTLTTLTTLTGITNALPAGTNLLGSVYAVPKTTCANTAYDSGPLMLPTTATAVTATSTCVMGIYLTNLDTVAHTVTVTDGSTLCAASVCTYVGPAFSIPALSNMNLPLEGMKFTTGVKWNVTDASSNKVVGQAYGFQ